MKTRFLIIALFALVPLFVPDVSALCAADVNYDYVLEESELAFTGTVMRLDNYDGPQKVTFFIHDVVKGDVSTPKHVFQNTGMMFLENDTIMSSSTDVDYKIGKTYKVYVINGQTSQCTTKITAPPDGYIWEHTPDVELLPDTIVQYGESFTIHAWLPMYDEKPDELQYFVDVLDSDNTQIDSTLWFAKEDFVYEFDTTHPAYNITKSGTYFIKIEKADQLQRTGSFYKTLEFKINFESDYLPPLKQVKMGIPLHEIQCNGDRTLIWQKNTLKPACVFHESELIFERMWAKMRIGMPAEEITQEKLCLWYSDDLPKYLAAYCTSTPESIFEEDTFIELMKNAVFDEYAGHYDYLPINDNPNMMSMEKITLQDDNSIDIEFGQNNYEWSTGYKPIPEFEYHANFKVNDTFVILCTNIGKDGYADAHPDLSKPYLPGLGIVKYLGSIIIEDEPILLFWHESASLQVDMPCSYPEVIRYSINLWNIQEHGLPTDSIVNALGSNYQK